jgi:hypothetical protein
MYHLDINFEKKNNDILLVHFTLNLTSALQGYD